MRARPILPVPAALLLALTTTACGMGRSERRPQEPAPAMSVSSAPLAPRIARVEAAVSEHFAALGAPGLSVALVDAGRVAWAGGRGLAVLETQAEATSQTVYRLGSLSHVIAPAGVGADAIRRQLFEPAGMKTARIAPPDSRVPDRAGQYRRRAGGGFEPAPMLGVDPGGTPVVLASVTDLARFAIALDDGALRGFDPAERPAAAWEAGLDDDGQPWAARGGETSGGAAYLLRRPQARRAVAVICNLDVPAADLRRVARAVEAAWAR